MLSSSDTYQADVIEAFISTSRYLDDLLNIDTCNPYFGQKVSQIYPTELQSHYYSLDTEALFLYLDLSITNDKVSS